MLPYILHRPLDPHRRGEPCVRPNAGAHKVLPYSEVLVVVLASQPQYAVACQKGTLFFGILVYLFPLRTGELYVIMMLIDE